MEKISLIQPIRVGKLKTFNFHINDIAPERMEHTI